MLELNQRDIHLGKAATNKVDAIENIALDLTTKGLVEVGYGKGMLQRESQNSTFLGNGIAIPHGTTDTRSLVKETGVQIHHFADGVDWGDGNTVYLAIGIAAKSDEHLGILKQLTHVLSADGVEEALKNAKSKDDILHILREENQKGLLFDSSVITLNFPATDMVSMAAVCAGKLKNAGAVGQAYVSELVAQQPTHVGQGLWIASSASDVKQTALSLVTVSTPFTEGAHPVKGFLAIAANGSEYIDVLNNLSALIHTSKTSEIFADDAEAVVKALTQSRQEGLSKVFKIKNAHGLHARPGAMLVSVAKKFDAQIWVANLSGDAKQVNAKSLMKVIALGVKHGHELEFTADGADADKAIEAIGEAIASGLGEG